MLSYFYRIFGKIAIFIIAALFSTELHAESLSFQEYNVKAAYLYNFAKFIEWPAESFSNKANSLDLCIIGKNPFGDAVNTIEGKTVKERRLVVRDIQSIRDIEGCNILFISESEDNNVSMISGQIHDKHILSVADMDGFVQRGGIINLTTQNNKIYFEINIDAAKRAGLDISSNLLKLSRIFRETNREGK